MDRVKKLYKLQLDNKFLLFKQKTFSGLLLEAMKLLLLVAAVTVVLYSVLSKIVFVLNITVNDALLAIVLLIMQAISLFFALANVINTLYLSKDNELLMVLPATFNQMFLSKILIVFVSDLLHGMAYILPVLITMGILGKFGLYYYLMALLFVPILTVLPIALSALISVPAIFILKFFKKRVRLSVVVILVLVATLFILYMSFLSGVTGAFNIMEEQIENSFKINRKILEIGESIFGYVQMARGMLSPRMLWFPAVFLAASVAIMCLCFLLIKPFYYRVCNVSSETEFDGKRRPRRFKKRKPFFELLLNEIRGVMRSPGYIFQFFLFPLFMPLIVYTYDKLLISIAVNEAGQNMIFGSHILVLCIVALMSNTISSIAISKEGGTFYIAKTTPVGFYTQVLAKLCFNFLFTGGAVLITMATTLLLTDLKPLVVMAGTLLALLLSAGHICHSFDLDLRHPVLDWYDSSEISTIGKNTTVSMIFALVLPAVMCLLVTLAGMAGLTIALLISLVYCLGRMWLLYVRTEYYYEHLEL